MHEVHKQSHYFSKGRVKKAVGVEFVSVVYSQFLLSDPVEFSAKWVF
jgi:hypothetical protein